MSTTTTCSSSSFGTRAPEKWVKMIKKMIQVKEVANTPMCIYKVPERLRVMNPEAYTPLCIGLGPYYHWCDDLYAMEPFKLIASKNSIMKDDSSNDNNDQVATQNLAHLANDLKNDPKFIPQVHASYDRHLDEDSKTLAWMMLIDGIFLLQFLQAYIDADRPIKSSCLSRCERTEFLVNQNISFCYAILQDIMKLENQIPTFVLEHVWKNCKISSDEQETLDDMLWEACKKLSPFELNPGINSRRDIKYSHLLELLYYLIVPEEPNDSSSLECRDVDREGPLLENNNAHDQERSLPRNCCCSNIPNYNLPPNIDIVLGLKWVSNVVRKHKLLRVICHMIRQVLTAFPNSLSPCQGRQQNSTDDPEKQGGFVEGSNNKEAPKVEEIDIPSVSQLLRVGIEFCPIDSKDMKDCLSRNIRFDKKTRKFYLPKITIRHNTEVIIRNLVAYEAVGISSPSILARYTELMNGIIDTAEDVRLLKERRIIDSKSSKSDDDVAKLWNRMSRSIRIPTIDSMNGAIRDINEYFNNKTSVKFTRFTKECMFCGWKITMLLLTLVAVVLMAIQSFCEVYRCPRALGPATEPGS